MVASMVHALPNIGLDLVPMHAYATHYTMVEASKAVGAPNWGGPIVAGFGLWWLSGPSNRATNGQKLLLICMGFSSVTADTPQLMLVSQNTIGGQRLLELGFSRAHKWSVNLQHACTACQGLRMPARAHTVATFVAHPKKPPPRGFARQIMK